jgi:hypothetical protein
MDALVLSGPFWAASALLVLAGVAKVRDPLPLVRALLSAGLPGRAPRLAAPVRVAAAAEAALGLWALLAGGRLAALLVALSYAGFTGFVLLARARGGVLASCGCFGRTDTPPTLTHAVVTGAAALAAVSVAAAPIGPLPAVLAASPASGVPLLAATGAVAVTAYVVLAVLPLSAASRTRARRGAPAAGHP